MVDGVVDRELAHLGKPDGVVSELRRGFRVPASVIEFAAQLLPEAAPGLAAPQSVRDNPGRLDLVSVAPGELVGATVVQVERLRLLEGSIGVIVPDARVAEVSRAFTKAGLEHGTLGATHGDVDHQVDLVPATVAKGLEFDHVLVLEPAEIATSGMVSSVGGAEAVRVMVSMSSVSHSGDPGGHGRPPKSWAEAC